MQIFACSASFQASESYVICDVRTVFAANRNRMYSLSDVAEIVFSNRRTIQFWVEARALIPSPQTNRAGRGNHRSFDASEVVVACILRVVSQNNLPIGRLIAYCDSVA
jgi:hypothetical protein